MDQPTPSLPFKLEEEDLAKFQLFTTYLQMAKLEKSGLEKDREILELKMERSVHQIENFTAQLLQFHQYLAKKYNVREGDQINYADGSIRREVKLNHEATTIQEATEANQEGARTADR